MCLTCKVNARHTHLCCNGSTVTANPLPILHASAALVVFDKPAGLPSVPGKTAELADCAWTRVRASYPDALVVHRLDMATSGLLLFARGALMQKRLSRAFEQRQVQKRYVAEVVGLIEADEGSMSWPLAADWPSRPRQKVDLQHGKPALTHFKVLARNHRHLTTRVELWPVTGRSHQLRVHLLTLGHPIVGDSLYGTPPPAHPDANAQAKPPDAMRLHAQWIQIPDPVQMAWPTPPGQTQPTTHAPPSSWPCTLSFTSHAPSWT
jgi:tRNA pseudouridine32 synthase / 23S rRNA pseudouridine746 synthase